MMHLKNISAGNPRTTEQYQLTKKIGVIWLYSEDGKNWYEEQGKFLPDTLKAAYTNTGRVVWVGKDVSAINPDGMSVIEMADITANRQINASGYWFYRDDKFIFDFTLTAESERNILLSKVSSKTAEWEKDLLLGLISDEDKEKLKAHRLYANTLRNMNFQHIIDKKSYNEITWPEAPGSVPEVKKQ
ncbi:tail fiber assembly protein [Citrobacter sp. TSA-1]|uniref:tail fiber assembly protein n=1 Tax=Citrobacter sp. TSA-1 TaxID=184912 RepID=UPI000BAE1AA7|nr:tail fiber assembly protein [Citrobacter sp. TSA-1]PAX78276.1 phage tail protein [Citrobacter sp. TSA-1]QKE19492.1 tail fiber assembly protein [Citrobacter sp. TSA-1]